jgi:hypothetical protein
MTMIAFNDIYFDDVLETLKSMGLESNITPSKTLGNATVRYAPNLNGKTPEKLHKIYRSLIGSLIWPAINWRLDIAYNVISLGRFTSNPSFEHLEGALEVLKYCLYTKRRGICYRRPPFPIPEPLNLKLVCYSDAD